MALGAALRRGRERHPEKRALIFDGQSWSYAQLDEITDRIAASLWRCGIRPGDRVALHFTNRPELLFNYYACFKLGAVAVPLNTRFMAPELEYVLNHSGARLFIGQPELFGEVRGARSRLAGVERYFLAGDAACAGASDGGAGADAAVVRPFEELLAPPEEAIPFPAVAEDALAVILYTSGSTARPKGVMHSHRTLERTVASISECFDECLDRQAEEIVGIAAPCCHIAALGCQLLPALALGATVVMIPRSDPATILRAIAEHRVTYFFGLPVTFQSLLDSPRDGVGDLSSLRMCLAGGDSVPIELQRRFQERLGVAIIEACGMTELIPYSANPIHGLNKAGSIGLPAPGVSVRLVDERGCDVPPGEVGEIVLQSEAMMLGYWQDPEATAAVVRDGWLSTGDMARCDEDGYYWFVGRKKEIIIRGGSNVSPPEVENALYQHPAVREAGVVGAPDAVWGEVVHAFVALHEGTALAEAELKQCVAQQLAAYKVPETIHFLPELPKGPTGKVHRKTLREWAAGGLTPIRG